MSDERLGLPSASSRDRDWRCPGNRGIVAQLSAEGSLRDDKTAVSESGDKIHEALETGDDSDLTHGETVSLESIQEKIDQIKEMAGVPDDAEEVKEVRLWLRDGLKKIASGKADLTYRWGDMALIIDAKSGWKEVTPSPENLQLRGLVALEFANNTDCDTVMTAIAPAVGKPHDVVAYHRETTGHLALLEWKDHIRKTEEQDAPRIPGNHCDYCPAKIHCPEARAVVKRVAATIIHGAGFSLPTRELEQFLDQFSGMAKKVIAEAEAEMKRRLDDDPDCSDIYGLSKPRKTEKIVDLPKAFLQAQALGITGPDFTSRCSITKTNLQELVQTKLNMKGKALNEAVSKIIEGATVTTYSKPSLTRAKTKKAIEAECSVTESIEGESKVE